MKIHILTILIIISSLTDARHTDVKNNNFSSQQNDFNNYKRIFKTQNDKSTINKIHIIKYAEGEVVKDLNSPHEILNNVKNYVFPNNKNNKLNLNLWDLLPVQKFNKTHIFQKIHNESTWDQMVHTENEYGSHFIEDTRNNSIIDLKYLHTKKSVRKRKMRQTSEYRNKNISYQSLCPTKRISIALETNEFEYRPNHYIEVSCAHSFVPTYAKSDDKNKICSEAGFSCMQLNRTMHLIRRYKSGSNECWESEIRVVPSGCECMWPKHYYGDILAYHESHKRYNTKEIPEIVSQNNNS